MATESVKAVDVLDACDALFNDLCDVRTMLVCVTGEGAQSFATMSDEIQEGYLFAMQRRVESALYGYHALRDAIQGGAH